MKRIFILTLLSVTLYPLQKAMAQQATEKKKSTAILNHIAVYTADLKTATDFYAAVFELEQIPEPFKDGRHTWFSLGAAGQLHIIQGGKTSITYDRNDHLCFSVPSVEEFTQKLTALGITYENWAGAKATVTKRVDGIKQIYFKDPDGHWLEVNDDHK
uniref:VOC family protein n=1 Tax=Pedobacter schmidteae TaxID=2201271 RepID=UPI001D013A6C|nr:VOC family protein [Pedobacter schmidteae]